MSKIGIIIDPHVTDRHRCRQDDFLNTVLEKLDYVANNNDYVLICGDLFHASHNPTYIFYRMYQLFNKHKGKFHAIPGNHDLDGDSLESFNELSLISNSYSSL